MEVRQRLELRRCNGVLRLLSPCGGTGTKWRDSGDILWCILSLLSVIVVAVLYHLLAELSFVLRPLGMAYFLCLLLQPVVDLLEQVRHPQCLVCSAARSIGALTSS